MAKIVAPLTVSAIRTAKPEAKVLRDGGGLYLLLQQSGRHLWRFDYRFQGTRKTLSMGIYPDVSLADARAKREDARKLVAKGIDPGVQRKAIKAAGVERAGNSFEVVGREWFGKQKATWAKSHADKIILRLENDVFPWLGKKPVADVTAKELLATLNRVVDRGAVESAHRVLQNCGQIFRYAIATGRAERNPAADLRGALPSVKPTHHAAILNPKEVGALLRAIDGYNGAFVTKCALKLAPLLFVRPGELRNAEWSEIDFEGAQWEIPGEKMKMGQPLIVPLAPQALEVLEELHKVTGRGRYVFPSARGGDRPMSNNAVLAALRRMGYANNEMTGHGFRAMARTILDETLQFRPDYIEQQLAHTVRDPNGRAYNRTAHLGARREMMQAWAEYLIQLKSAPSY